MTEPILSIRALEKTYKSGVRALQPVSLDIRRGEIFALLGPNGAGKTTLIGIICGLVNASAGEVLVDGLHWRRDYRTVRAKIGLVPQELTTDAFEPVEDTLAFSRGLFGLAPDPARLEETLRALSLWDKRKAKILSLSGGMKRRVMIAKALAHEPQILFLDEPSAGVDVELRQDMWAMVRGLRDRGVTIILTTHYLEEAEEMADRIGVIAKGELLLVEEKASLMRRLGARRLTVHLRQPLSALPHALGQIPGLALQENGGAIIYTFDAQAEDTGVAQLIRQLDAAGLDFKDLQTEQSSLEEIFVGLVKGART